MDKSLSKKQRKQLKLKQKHDERQNQKQQRQNNTVQEQVTQKKGPPQSENASKNLKQKKKEKKNQQKVQESEQSNQQKSKGNDDEMNLDFNNVIEGENVQVSFLISEINEKQYHSMKTILEKFARITGIISSEWADAIISNAKGGNSVLADDDDEEEEQEDEQEQEAEDDEQDVCNGVINVLPHKSKLTRKLIDKTLKTLENKNIKIYGTKTPSQLLKANCSLLICERAINLPAFIVKSMHEVLVNDLKQLKKQNSTEYTKICGNYILGVSQVELPKNGKKGMGKDKDGVDIQQIVFSRFEDYLFIQKSGCWWVGEGSANSVKKFPLHKIYFVISLQKYLEAVGEIGSLLQEE